MLVLLVIALPFYSGDPVCQGEISPDVFLTQQDPRYKMAEQSSAVPAPALSAPASTGRVNSTEVCSCDDEKAYRKELTLQISASTITALGVAENTVKNHATGRGGLIRTSTDVGLRKFFYRVRV